MFTPQSTPDTLMCVLTENTAKNTNLCNANNKIVKDVNNTKNLVNSDWHDPGNKEQFFTHVKNTRRIQSTGRLHSTM